VHHVRHKSDEQYLFGLLRRKIIQILAAVSQSSRTRDEATHSVDAALSSRLHSNREVLLYDMILTIACGKVSKREQFFATKQNMN
jgi:hypothetical protein